MTLPRIAVIGGGLMGAGIAQVFAANGYDVTVQEPDAATHATVVARVREGLTQLGLDPAHADRVRVTISLPEAVHDAAYVTEAAPEKLPLKQAIFAQLEAHAPADAILASNTSVMPIGSIVAGLASAHRMIGTHWWNPAPLIPLIEVVQAAQTSDATVAATMALLASIGKKPAHVRKDTAGFVANRLQHALWREAIAMVAEGICDARTLDDCVKHSFGLRLPVLGPLENADLVGIDLTLDIHRTIMPILNCDTGPNPILEAMVAAGKLGFKSGQGFQIWSAQEQADLRQRLTNHLSREAEAKADGQ